MRGPRTCPTPVRAKSRPSSIARLSGGPSMAMMVMAPLATPAAPIPDMALPTINMAEDTAVAAMREPNANMAKKNR